MAEGTPERGRMPRVWRRWYLAVLALSGVGAYWLAKAAVPAPAESIEPMPEVLRIGSKYLDIGEVWESKRFPWVVRLENPSAEPVTVERIIPSCQCTRVEPESLTIPAHDSAEVRLYLRLSAAPEQSPVTDRLFKVRLTAVLRGSGPPCEWVLRGRVRPAIDVDRRALDLGEVVVGRAFETQTIRVRTLRPDADLQATWGSDAGALTVTRLGGRGESVVWVRPNPPLRAGVFEEMIRLSVLEHGEQLGLIEIPVRGVVREIVAAVPAEMRFGAMGVGEAADEALSIQAADGRQFRVENIVGDLPGLEVKPLKGTAALHRYRVRYRPPGGGFHSGLVRWTVLVEGEKTSRTIVVPVSGYGIAPN